MIINSLFTSLRCQKNLTENVLFLKFIEHVACDPQGHMRSPVQLKLVSCDFLDVYPGKSLSGNICINKHEIVSDLLG